MDNFVGRTGKVELHVREADTAGAWGSGLLMVLSTPRLVALMEQAACEALRGVLSTGQTTVGTRIDIRHVAATPVGMRAWAEANCTAAEGRALSFSIQAFDEAGPIGNAVHERFLVDSERFMAKIQAKKPSFSSGKEPE